MNCLGIKHNYEKKHFIKIKDKRENHKISKDKRYTKLKLKNNKPTPPKQQQKKSLSELA